MGLIDVMPVLVHREHTDFIFSWIWRAGKKHLPRIADIGVATHEDVNWTWLLQVETLLGPLALLDRIACGDLGMKGGKGLPTYPDSAWQSPLFIKSASP